ncbi:MAG: hypothetical protein BWZ04_01995 [Firmicutes bacterium ADurb.BinA205]|nr:MAG: hypothetical protein BWZ04_01995 [Firmicutes bacterium ADurb.BinA205]
MDRFEKHAEYIMERGDRILAEKANKAKMIKRFSLSGAGVIAAAIVGIFTLHSAPSVPERIPVVSEVISTTSGYASDTVTTVPATTQTKAAKTTVATQQTTSATSKSSSVQNNRTEVTATVSLVQMTEAKQINTSNTDVSEQIVSTLTTESDSPVNPAEPTAPPPRYMTFKNEDTGIWYSRAEGAVSADRIDKIISEQVLIDNDGESSNAALYAIKEITPEAMIAVQFDGTDGFTLYRNMEYMPETLGEFISDTGIDAYALFKSAEYFDFSNGYELRNYYDIDSEIVISHFRDCEEALCYRYGELTPEQVNAKMNLICDMNKAFLLTAGFGISKKGYLTTNLTGGGLAFYIGEDKAAEIISFITDNYPYTVW